MAVDVHGHLLVPEANALAAGHPREEADSDAERAAFSAHSIEVNRAQIRRVLPQLTDVDRRLVDLAAAEVTHQVVGPMPMHRYWAEQPLALRLTRAVNEAVTEHCRKAPDQLIGLGTLPLQHPDLAVAELEYATKGLGLKGISVSTNVDGRELADPDFEVIWKPPPNSARSSSSTRGVARSANGSAGTSSATRWDNRWRRHWPSRI